MRPTSVLHKLGQSLWLDNITRELLNSGMLQRFIDEFSVTGLTSNPTIFDNAIRHSSTYDDDISRRTSAGKFGDDLFFELALSRGGKPNLFIKIPGTAEGLPAIEAAIFAGVPVNVTLLFSREQYLAAAGAYLRGVERRIDAGLNPAVASVASLFISRWDVAVSGKVPRELTNRLGIAIAQRTYRAYQELLASARFQRAANAGARAQRLLWASTGTKDPTASDVLYVKALAAPFTINTMPEGTLRAFDDHGEAGEILAPDGGDCERVLASFAQAGVDIDALAVQLQDEGAASFVKSWNDLLACIDLKSATIRKAS
jgi:transaldolase